MLRVRVRVSHLHIKAISLSHALDAVLNDILRNRDEPMSAFQWLNETDECKLFQDNERTIAVHSLCGKPETGECKLFQDNATYYCSSQSLWETGNGNGVIIVEGCRPCLGQTGYIRRIPAIRRLASANYSRATQRNLVVHSLCGKPVTRME
ncbi:hypothetical protein J6590_049888 [Homalodisca vitripennis]|nr:hypothetical protein J6590_049888 [Homalodisca vitripennis]